MSKTQTIVLVTLLAVVLVLAVGAKLLFFPSVKDVYFATSQRSLLKVPPGLTAIRPTHSPLHRETIIYASPGNGSGGDRWRMSGRNVSLQDLIATAYGETRGRVILPAGTPTNNAYDFVATAPDPRLPLQKAIHDTLHYTADKESNDVDVLAIKIVDPTLPGLTVSAAGKGRQPSFKDGKMTIYHIQFKELANPFEQILKTPVVDETGLSNFYDATLEWNKSMGSRFQNPSTARPVLDKILQGWGLAFEPDTASVEVLMVKKVY